MSNRSYYIAGNWKMHKTRAEAADLAKALVSQLKDGKHKYLVAPSFTSLETVAAIVKGTNIRLGAQDCACEEQGAHTGEVSVLQKKLNQIYVKKIINLSFLTKFVPVTVALPFLNIVTVI